MAEMTYIREDILSLAVPVGWKLVPSKLTTGMIKVDPYLGFDELQTLWSLLLAAAPTPPAAEAPGQEPVAVTYTNWRGETFERLIIPRSVWFGATDWHPEPQWLVKAFDVQKQAERDFALKDFGSAPTKQEPMARSRDELINVALAALDNYADPSGYTDSNGDQSQSDADVHPGLLAKTVAAEIRSALISTPPTYADAEAKEFNRGIAAAAKFVMNRLLDYVSEHGSTDPETGTVEFPGDGDEYVGELEEIEEGIRSLAPSAPAVSNLQKVQSALTDDGFQAGVGQWMMSCFGREISADKIERNHRFIEEALELVQALGCTDSEAHQLVDYVYGRPAGEPVQEVGGVMVTLAALCLANGMDMVGAGDTELARIWTKVDTIRAKQAAKPKHSPLPASPASTGGA